MTISRGLKPAAKKVGPSAAQMMQDTKRRKPNEPSSSLADEIAKTERTLAWSTAQKRELLYEAQAYAEHYQHLQRLLSAADGARAKTFDKRHKISYEDAKSIVVKAMRDGDDVPALNALLVATGNLRRPKLGKFPNMTAQEWANWINEVVNHPPNVYLGSSAQNQALGRKWDPRKKDDEFGIGPEGQFQPGSPITEWQLHRFAAKGRFDPVSILADENVLAAAWAVQDHYTALAKLAKRAGLGSDRQFFDKKAEALPDASWGVTHRVKKMVSVFMDLDEQEEIEFLALKDRPQ